MGLLGYEPERFYPSGRASFEALAKGIPLQPDDLVFRCNTVTVDKIAQTLADFTGGMITDANARQLISQIKLPHKNWEIYPGQSYRNILIVRGAGIRALDVKCFEPHMNIGKKIADILVQSKNPAIQSTIDEINSFLLSTRAQIEAMELSSDCAANMLWLWSPSEKPTWPSFKERIGLNAAVVGGLDFIHGIAMAAKIHFDVIPGATGYIDTDYRAKAAYALRYLRDFDFVLVHVNAADEEAHQHNYNGKISAIEQIDCHIIGPLLSELQHAHAGDFRLAVCGDHTTRCSDGKHTDAPVPYAIFGNGIEAETNFQFSERSCESKKTQRSLDFLTDLERS